MAEPDDVDVASAEDELLGSDEAWSSALSELLALLADDVWGVELVELAVLVGVDGVELDPALGAAVLAADALEEVVAEDELVWLAAAGVVALEPAPAEPGAGGESMFVCRRDEKLCDGALADAELAGGAELGPDIISRIAGVMKRAART